MEQEIIKKIENINFWKSNIKINKIQGGITNQNFLVEDCSGKYVVRLGLDMPEHLISRSNELSAIKAASDCNISPSLAYFEEGVIILDFIECKTLNENGVIKNLSKIIPLIKKIHLEVPKKIKGYPFIFWIFYTINHYSKFLLDNNSLHKKIIKDLLEKSELLEINSSPYEIVFGHNDLLCGNFLDDGSKIWIIDWEYSGYNSPLFDLGGLASNNNFNYDQEEYLLENYFEKKINNELLLKYESMKCMSLLRETMWSMVSEITSKIDFNYKTYTQENITKFNSAFNKMKFNF